MNKLENNYLNIPIIETKRLILNYPLRTDYKVLEESRPSLGRRRQYKHHRHD